MTHDAEDAPAPPPMTAVPLAPRLRAFAIDFAVPLAAFMAFWRVGAAVSGRIGPLAFLVGWLALIVFCAWQVFEEGTTGQTVGKRMQHIKLVRASTGEPIGPDAVLLRGCVNGLAGGLGWMFLDAGRRTLGDRLSGSVVVPAY